MNKMKILVVGGVHGNEQTGIALARVFIADKDARINGLVVNREAVRKKVRFLETDLNRSFGVLCPITIRLRPGPNFIQSMNLATGSNHSYSFIWKGERRTGQCQNRMMLPDCTRFKNC